jgi:hypothetical protein
MYFVDVIVLMILSWTDYPDGSYIITRVLISWEIGEGEDNVILEAQVEVTCKSQWMIDNSLC